METGSLRSPLPRMGAKRSTQQTRTTKSRYTRTQQPQLNPIDSNLPSEYSDYTLIALKDNYASLHTDLYISTDLININHIEVDSRIIIIHTESIESNWNL